MRQILIKKAEHLRPDPSRPGQALLVRLAEGVHLQEGLNLVRLPAIEVLSGGAARFRYSLSKDLASQGVFLTGAYEEAGEIQAYLVSMVGETLVAAGEAVLCVESYCPDSLMPVVMGDQAKFQNGVLVLSPDAIETPKKRSKRKPRGRRS